MSIFDYPRIHVFGTQYVNAGTANNDSVGPGTEISVTSNSEQVQPAFNARAPEEFRAWLIGLDQNGLLRCQWNYYGDMSMHFTDVRVRSVQHTPGVVVTDPAADPLIGAQVALDRAIVCDNDPEGFNTTQIFADALTIRSRGDRPAFAGTGTFVSRRPTRAVTRGLNWSRNVSFHGILGNETSGGAAGASAGFQCSIEVHDDNLVDVSDTAVDQFGHHLVPAADSPTVARLATMLRERSGPRPMRGLTFRYNLHLAYPVHSDPSLAEQFAAGLRTENPAVGVVTGTIAPWYVGEPTSGTMGRVLNPTRPYPNAYASRDYLLAPAVANVDASTKTLSIDLSNTLPADGPDGEAYDLGRITIGHRRPTQPATDPNANTEPLDAVGVIDPDRDLARDRSYLYDLDYSGLPAEQQSQLERGDTELVLDTGLAGVLLFEPEHHILLDSECNYLDEPPPGVGWRQVIPQLRSPETPTPLQGRSPIVIWQRGKPVTGPLAMRVEQWQMTPSGDPNQFGLYHFPSLLTTSATTVTVNDGWGNVDLVPVPGPGVRLFRYVPPTLWPQERPPDVFAWLICAESYATLRVLPYDDFSDILARGVTWDDLYQHVLCYYDLLMPAMNTRLPMNDASFWESPTSARYLKRVIDPALFESTTYMPRTRDLSGPRRELLVAFCDAVLAGHDDPEAAS
ncbi:MAG TPA: hypothetical protein VK917_05185 [Ilumatobacter sp.]|nr:hypothetical protein [Ilumatobacter sp.]